MKDRDMVYQISRQPDAGSGVTLGLAVLLLSAPLLAGSALALRLASVGHEVTVGDSVVIVGEQGVERVLVAEGNPVNQRVATGLLESLGYRVLAASGPAEAIRMANAGDTEIHLLLTDVVMPEMTGDKLAMEIKKIRSEIPVIMCTGFSHKMTYESKLEMGIQTILMKPLSLEKLSTTIRKVLDGTEE